ncbi:putative polyketide synthase [Aspergillus uvarum CBS 121591]|uniref:Putative polyketide synthase n=1 Tax=Aspergillus uvarum CBS 121591 TaxID=1448315 RepID=A0A319CPK1_9EURO|nr:putative polyketide synthase [Aspergillus uvarum CBS 121591]PYH87315.1 putative polyketide synthase [Aspergillus uvarum CBS 121591]
MTTTMLTESKRQYVGSIKTVCGHTEGAAEIAAVLKGSLALQHKTIPPNLLFNQWHPNVQPFSEHLAVPTQALLWPVVAPGQPRRASINSFGFGCANAHAILESYEMAVPDSPPSSNPAVVTAFLFSATSERSLNAMLSAYAAWLQQPFPASSAVNLRNLSYTLHARRSELSVRAAIPATSSVETLTQRVASRQAQGASARILGVFTGQGTQYMYM